MEKQRRRDARGIVGKIAAVVFAAGFVLSIVPAIRALAEGTIFKIQSAEITEISTGASGSINTYDEQTIVSNVTFHKINDSISYKIVLQNSDSKDHIIESITDDNASKSINYIYDAHAGETVAAGADLDFLLTAKYTNGVTDTSKRAEVSNVKFFVKFTDVEEPEEIDIVVPNTGKNTAESNGASISLATMIISVIGLTILAVIAVKKHKKYAKIIGVAVVAVSAFGLATTAKAVNIETNSFTLTTNYGLYDKLVIKNGDKDVVIDYGEKLEDVDEITEPTKPGYTFDGWEDENGNPVDPTKPITKDITIKPKFIANTYTVKFDANGGNGAIADMQFTYDEAQVLTQNAFNFMGREYTGWDTKPNGSGVHYADKAEVKNLTTENNGIVTLYAQWSINPFHIDYDGNGATSGEMATTNCEYDEACQLRDNAFEKYGYDFVGWKYNDTIYADKTDVTNIIDHGAITMQAQWTPHVYTITYTGLTTEEAAALRTAGNPDNYTVETASFTLIKPADRKDADGDVRERCIGWRDVTVYEDVTLPISNALGDKTYEAVWQTVALEEFDITYDYDGGSVATANPTKLTKEQSANLNEPAKTGYTFTGWTGTTIEGSTPVKPYAIPAPHQKGNLAYTAHYRANNYTIAFDGNGATSGSTASTSMTYDEAKNLTANGFARTGYTFAGWKLGDTNFTNEQEVNNLTAEDGATVTLKAQWTPNTFTIIFHHTNNEVSNQDSMTPQAITYDVATTIKPNTYEREHYKFMGWATNATQAANANTRAKVNTAKVYDDEANITNAVTENNGELHLYAIWLERTSELNKGFEIWWGNFREALGNNDIVSFEEYTGDRDVSAIESKRNIALNGSNFPTYLWMETDEQGAKRAYWWSEAEHPKMNSDIRQMFDALPQIERIDLSGFIFPNATVMSGVFRGDTKLTTVIFPSEAPTIAAGTSMANMFNGCASLKNLNMIKNWDFSGVTDMSGLLQGARSLKSLESIKDWNVSNVESMSGMFKGSGIESVSPIKNWNVNNVENMNQMFMGATKLTSVDLSNWHTSGNLKNIKEIFAGGITNNPETTLEIDLSGWNTSNVIDTEIAFGNGRITELDVSGWDMSSLVSGPFMFGIYANNIETIYYDGGSLPFDSEADTHGIFRGDAKLVGGAGSTSLDKELNVYARVDDPCSGKPGYFTLKDHQYICFHANNGTDARKGQYVSTTASGQLEKNEFTHEGFRFLGWAESDDATAPLYTDEAAITLAYIGKEPKNLYAVWEPETYTISFNSNIDDATGTMGDQTVTHGTQTPLSANAFKKDHWRFLGWTTSQESNVVSNESQHVDFADQAEAGNITEDLVLHAKWLFRCRTFETDSWATIVANLENDPNYYDATDVCEKVISMPDDNGDTQDYTLRLINTSTPEECATAGFSQTGCGTVIEFGTMATLRRWNPTGTTAGGWKASELNGWLNSTFYDRMPEDLKNVIIPTYLIVSGNGQGQDSPDITAADVNLNKIFLPTRKEFGMNASEDNAADRMRTWDFYTIAEHRSSYVRNRQGGGTWPRASWDRSARNNRTNLSTADMMGTENRVATYPVFRIGRKFTVSFDAGEGAASETAREYAVSAMNYSTLPTVTTAPEGKIFAGWYTAAEGGDRVNDNDTFVSSNAHTLYAHWITPTFYNITEMQQMTADICATATTPNTNASQFDTTGENVGNKSYIPRRELIDNRDGKSYQVTKLADGKCWMTENLAIGDPDSTMTLTSADSDVTSSLTLPQSNIAAFTGSTDVDAVYVDDTFGGYYSSRVARANYTNEGNSSICPKGWRLPNPTMSTPRDWEILKSTYNISSVNALYGEPFNFTRSFYVGNGAIKRNNGWIDTYYVGPGITSNSYNNFGVYIPDNWTGTSGITGAEGGSVRCVAR